MKTVEQLHEEIDAEFQHAKNQYFNKKGKVSKEDETYLRGVFDGLCFARDLSFNAASKP